MTDERELESDFSSVVSVADAPSNGTAAHVDAPAEDLAPEAPIDSALSDPDDTRSADVPAADAAASDAPADDAPADDAPSAGGDQPESTTAEPHDFLTQLARAMQATAGAERSRVTEEIDRRRSAHLAAIHDQRDAEVARMRELADEDRRGIDEWAEAEHRRIQAERDRRTTELEADLTKSLEEHRRQVDDKVQTVEFAVTAHRAEVDAFFDALDAETDPVRIAQQAGLRPVFPDLDAVVEATLPSPAAPEPAVVGVMDPVARLGLLNRTDHVSPAQAMLAGATSPVDSGSGPSVMTLVSSRTSGRPEEEPQPEATPAPHTSSGHGPMGWLRRGNDQGDR